MPQARAAAVYVRISEDKPGEDEEEGAGVRRQEADCRALAARLGWEVAEPVYVENDTSAFKRRSVRLPDGSTGLRVLRPAFRRLLDDLTSGACDGLIAYDLDRVARDPRDLEDLIDAVERRRIPTRSVTGSLDLGTDAGVTMARVMVAVANKASRDTARRVARKQVELAERGKFSGGGVRSYGYEKNGVTVNEHEAAVVREVAGRVLAGETLRSITAELNRRGEPTVRGGAWHSRSVHSVVTKARNAGLREFRGEIVGPAEWPAILERAKWEQVRMALADRGAGATNVLVRWLTGVLRCALCGRPLFGWSGSGQRGRGPRYWCATPHGGCGRIVIDATYTEAFVSDLITSYLSRPDVLADLRSAASSSAADRARQQAQSDAAQLKELAQLWGAKAITTAEYLTARKEIENRLSQWQQVMRASLPGAVRDLLACDIEGKWELFGAAQRREVARVVFPDGISVQPSRQNSFKGFDAERLVPANWKGAEQWSTVP